MPAGRMPGHAYSLQIELSQTVLLMSVEQAVGAAKVFKRPRPSATGVSHAPIFHVPRCHTDLLECVAKVPRVGEVILRAPIAAMYEEDNRMRPFSRRQTHINKLAGVLSVRHAQIRIGRLL